MHERDVTLFKKSGDVIYVGSLCMHVMKTVSIMCHRHLLMYILGIVSFLFFLFFPHLVAFLGLQSWHNVNLVNLRLEFCVVKCESWSDDNYFSSHSNEIVYKRGNMSTWVHSIHNKGIVFIWWGPLNTCTMGSLTCLHSDDAFCMKHVQSIMYSITSLDIL